ncbi:MAG: STAS/SEC14 domain-containing protein [Gammaproteobacteria bacterium]|jgi:hypothetical protein|nr:STAS/SEC14 domain-containing protein [Gammaproteobacteria bacterium]
MFKVTPNGPNRVDIELSGKLDSDEMRFALEELISETASIEHGRMLYRIDDFEFPTFGAIGIELSRLPELLRVIGKFDRAAVLVDTGWIKKVSEFEGALMPGLEIKAFDRDQEAEAEAWLAS